MKSDLEVLVLWQGGKGVPARYRVVDASDGGMCIRCMQPLERGATGTVLSTVPHSATVTRDFTVVWCRPSREVNALGLAYEAGLRFD